MIVLRVPVSGCGQQGDAVIFYPGDIDTLITSGY
jgi:hypothetical protein